MSSKETTLQFYKDHAQDFVKGTLSADMSEARQHFLQCLPESARILDFGCGSGRDTKAFLDLGYQVDACDGSEELCRIASEVTGIPIRHMLFQELNETDVYDGIWACASILHLPKEELAAVLRKIADALKKKGMLYTSFKYGDFEGMRGGRYFTNFTEDTVKVLFDGVPALQITELWITGDVRPGRGEERWINILARRSYRSIRPITIRWIFRALDYTDGRNVNSGICNI